MKNENSPYTARAISKTFFPIPLVAPYYQTLTIKVIALSAGFQRQNGLMISMKYPLKFQVLNVQNPRLREQET